MKPRVFVVQPIPEVGLDVLREYAEVEVYPHTDQQISTDDLIGAARRSDYIFAMHETTIPESVIQANPNLKGIVGGRNSLTIDVDACDRYGVPLLFDPNRRGLGVSRATADLTVAMILNSPTASPKPTGTPAPADSGKR